VGQQIDVKSINLGEVAIFDTDRSLTGQDGHAYGSADAAVSGEGFPAGAAASVFEAVDGIEYVFLASNQVVVRRESGWDEPALGAVGAALSRYFIFYKSPESATA
jgi:hypothetical protein